MGDVIKAHPLMVKRWAKCYVDRYLRDGSNAAISWAMGFLNREDIKLVAKEARDELRRRGRRSPPPRPGAG